MTTVQTAAARPLWHYLMPPLFVVLWASGFVVTKLGVRFAGHIAVVGVFLQAMYLGGVYTAIARGIPAGISALIVGVQPIVTAVVVGPLLGERVRARQW